MTCTYLCSFFKKLPVLQNHITKIVRVFFDIHTNLYGFQGKEHRLITKCKMLFCNLLTNTVHTIKT